ncbi:ribonucleotide-diphosphate reductase subunit beta [Salegentibacter sediminis]|uniref:ribonucleotide-diphosphate reductase subunit beta n=1 Tax=Salegentibacter sediminis TaxID=1930251 RepID=UPI0009C0FF1D|nr:ribonucleotide-diphosphate reductase subunit beta [Salegentibacter sediminis]
MSKSLQETTLKDDKNRFIIFPVKHHDIWDWYKKMASRFWTPHTDISDHKLEIKVQKLNTNEVHFLRNLMAFLAGSQNLASRNITRKLKGDTPEANFCFDFQAVSENVYVESFSMLTRAFLKRPKTEERLFSEINPQLKIVENRIKNWTGSGSLAEALVASAALNAIFFPAALSSLLWIKKRKDLSGFNYYCELISRDKIYHRDLAIHLYSEKIKKDISPEKIREIILETENLIGDFLLQSLPVNLIGMPVEHMEQYLKLLSDNLFEKFGCKKNTEETSDQADRRPSLAEQRVGKFQQAGKKIDKDSDKISFKTDL